MAARRLCQSALTASVPSPTDAFTRSPHASGLGGSCSKGGPKSALSHRDCKACCAIGVVLRSPHFFTAARYWAKSQILGQKIVGRRANMPRVGGRAGFGSTSAGVLATDGSRLSARSRPLPSVTKGGQVGGEPTILYCVSDDAFAPRTAIRGGAVEPPASTLNYSS